MPKNSKDETLNRRELFGRGSVLALSLLAGGAGALHAEEMKPEVVQDAPSAAPVTVAVIGLGEQGRELLKSLGYAPNVTVKYVCDTYEGIHARALEIAPKATAVTDYKKVLADAAVQGVFIATPSHQHKQIVTDAFAAGKHVYCEAPLASSLDEAKVIALAAKSAAPKLVFQAGLQSRTNPQHHHVLKFVRTGALGGKIAQGRAQWHRKTSWRKSAASDERQSALNWRLNPATSSGLLGEVGIHQLDIAAWFLNKRPVAVSGFGGVVAWQDGRKVPDTVQCLVEFPENIHLTYDATLANSFDGAYDLYQGTDAAVVLKDQRAWMFKEPDATPLGWEVYAYKEKVGDETGIALVADASKLLADGKNPSENRNTDPRRTALYYACEAFANSIRSGKPTDADYKAGYEATVLALKANEAVLSGSRIVLADDLFVL